MPGEENGSIYVCVGMWHCGFYKFYKSLHLYAAQKYTLQRKHLQTLRCCLSFHSKCTFCVPVDIDGSRGQGFDMFTSDKMMV